MKYLPKKRYLMIGCVLVYAFLKIYTSYTPSKEDDGWADSFKDSVGLLASKEDKRNFGENA